MSALNLFPGTQRACGESDTGRASRQAPAARWLVICIALLGLMGLFNIYEAFAASKDFFLIVGVLKIAVALWLWGLWVYKGRRDGKDDAP